MVSTNCWKRGTLYQLSRFHHDLDAAGDAVEGHCADDHHAPCWYSRIPWLLRRLANDA